MGTGTALRCVQAGGRLGETFKNFQRPPHHHHVKKGYG